MAKELRINLVVDDKGTPKIQQFGRTVDKNMSRSAASTGKMTAAYAALTAAVVGYGAAIAKVTQVGVGFEKSIMAVKAISGATGKEFNQLSEIAKKMGATTEWSASQSADALKYMAMAGMEVQDMIKALPGMLDLATAGQVDLAQASDIVTDTLTAFGLEVEELTRLSDVFVKTSSSANTNIEMLGESFKYVAPVAASMGYSIEKTSAFLGIMANAGVKASMAGTDLRAIMLRTSVAAEKLGLDSGASLVEVLEEMRKKQISATEATEIFGRISSKSALILANNIDQVKEFTSKLENAEGASGKIAATMRDTLGNDLKTLQSTLEGVALEMFDIFGADARSAIKDVTELVRDLTPVFQVMAESASLVFKAISGAAKFAKRKPGRELRMTDEFGMGILPGEGKPPSKPSDRKGKPVDDLEAEIAKAEELHDALGKSFADQLIDKDKAQEDHQARSKRRIEQQSAWEIAKAQELHNAMTDSFVEQQEAMKQAVQDNMTESEEVYLSFQERISEMTEDWNPWQRMGENLADIFGPGGSLAKSMGQTMSQIIVYGKQGEDVFKKMGQAILGHAVKAMVEMGAQMAINWAMEKMFKTASTATSVAQAATVATSWAPAAALASLASFGMNATAAMSGMMSTYSLANVLALPRESGGDVAAGSPYVVGERGRELFIPDQSGQIISNADMTQPTNINVGSLVTVEGALIADESAFNDFVETINDRLYKLKNWGY